MVVVCTGLNESAAARRVFLTGGGEQKIQDFQPSGDSVLSGNDLNI